MGAGGAEGIYLPAAAEICKKYNKSSGKCEVLVTRASVENVQLLDQREINIGIAQRDILYKAWNGIAPFKKKHGNLRSLIELHIESISIMVREDSDIYSLQDLRDRRIYMDQKGSGVYRTARELLAFCDITESDYVIAETKVSQIFDEFKSRRLDAIFDVVGHPAAKIQQIAHDIPVRFIPVKGDCVENIVQIKPYFEHTVIAANTYKGVKSDTQTIGVRAILVTTKLLSPIKAQLIKDIVSNNISEFRKQISALSSLGNNSDLNKPTIPIYFSDSTLDSNIDETLTQLSPDEEHSLKHISVTVRDQSSRLNGMFNFWDVALRTSASKRPHILVADQVHVARKIILEHCVHDKRCMQFSQKITNIINAQPLSLSTMRRDVRKEFNRLADSIDLEHDQTHKKNQLIIRFILVISTIIVLLLFTFLVLALRNQRRGNKALKEKQSQLKNALEALKEQAISLERANEVNMIIGQLLKTSFGKATIEGQLLKILEIILSLDWGLKKGKGCIFLADANSEDLLMMAQIGFPDDVKSACSKVSLGHCLCGLAGKSKEIVFASSIDDRHSVVFRDMEPHGHYCVPILSHSRILGVLNLYVEDGHEPANDEEKFLVTIAEILAELVLRREAEDHIKHQAYNDQLTGLPNRVQFFIAAKQALLDADRKKTFLAVLFLDLNHFKWINDTYGHEVGDFILKELSSRLLSALRLNDVAARLGGDEFTVLLKDIQEVKHVAVIAEKILSTLIPLATPGGLKIQIASSIGISIYPEDGDTVDALLSNADTAMYYAKDRFKEREGQVNLEPIELAGAYRFYNAEMRAEEFRRQNLKEDLKIAIKKNQFVLYYQPLVALVEGCGTIIGAEALIRWIHPERGPISPNDWIPFAEETGLILEIGKWVNREGCRQIAEWRDKGLPQIYVTLNNSGKQLEQEGYLETVLDPIKEYNISRSLIGVEVTETLPLSKVIIRVIQQLRKEGITVMQDDFGTGHSSLANFMLKLFNILKIDRSFIVRLSDDSTFVEMLIGMAHTSGAKAVAEGVETQEQLALLVKLGCDVIQGYICSKPLPADVFEELLRKRISSLECWADINVDK